MQTGQISVQTENIFPIIKQYLYSDQEIFLRELVSNAIDATSKLKILSNKGEYKGDLGSLRIEIVLDKEAGTLSIVDRGIGMTEEEVMKYLNQVAFSSAQEFLEKYKQDSAIIGHFGLGFYSAFMVAERVEVYTKSYKGNPAVKWSCTGDTSYSIEPAQKEDRGTEIRLYIDKDNDEYLEDGRIQELLDKYCKFLPIEIRFGTKEDVRYEGEGDDRKEIKETVDNVVNNPHPLWKKSPTDIPDEEYLAFYRELHPYSPEPLFWIHLNIDYPFNLTGVLYFPKMENNIEVQKNKIHLYSNQVYVTDEVREIVPEFLTLLHGIIDSPDIPLNVSRSYLQSDRNVKKITNYITKKVAERLKDLFKEDRAAFENKWEDIGVFIKYGMISEPSFYDKAKDFALLKNIDGDCFTIDQYKEKIENTQKDKHDRIVHIYANHATAQDSFVEGAKEEGYDVLLFDQVLDNHYIQHLESKLDKVTFVRVDSDTPDKLVQKEEEVDSVLSETEIESVKSLFKEYTGLDEHKIEMRAMSPSGLPVSIVKPEFLRRMEEMQQMQGGNLGMKNQFFNLIVNTNHDLITNKVLKMEKSDDQQGFIKYLYNLALLNQNMLIGKELTEFIKQSLRLASEKH